MANPKIYRILTLLFFLMAVVLRILLYWANPPENSFDDHYEPIFLLLEEGRIPPKDACWECFQPPVYYLLAAGIGHVIPGFAEIDTIEQLKLFQFLPLLYGILTVYLVYLVLNRVRLSDFARTMAFGLVCFLPRHIYMSAMHTNDTLSYLLVTLCTYLMLVAIDHNLIATNGIARLSQTAGGSYWWQQGKTIERILIALALMMAMLLALFTKSTGLVVLPMMATIFAFFYVKRMMTVETKSILMFALLVFVPLAAICGSAMSDIKAYGRPMPLNIELLEVRLRQPPGADDLSFITFKPWITIESPILAPENVASFWTLIYSRMWFDMEPKFLQYTNPNDAWWEAYDDYLNRHDNHDWPGEIPLSPFTQLTGSVLIALGLIPLLLILIGIGHAAIGKWSLWSKSNPVESLKVQLFLVLLIANIAGVMFHTYRYPFYSFMKSAFMLNALPALAVFLALGLMWQEKIRAFRWGTTIVFGVIFLLVTVHILNIVQALGFGRLQFS